MYVEGRIQYRTYDDKNGVKRYVTEIVMDEMVMLDSKGREGVSASSADKGSALPPPPPSGPTAKDDDLPF